jgi:hypothetical protein
MELRTEIEIEAPPAAIWKVLTDFARYPEWNPFIPEISGQLEVGSELQVVIAPPDSSEMRFRPTLLALKPDEELRWRGKLFVSGLFDGEHFFRLIAISSHRTRFVHGENFSGILVKMFRKTLTQTARGFVFMNQALKRRVETSSRDAANA